MKNVKSVTPTTSSTTTTTTTSVWTENDFGKMDMSLSTDWLGKIRAKTDTLSDWIMK